MILRPRQVAFVDRCVAALRRHGDTLGVAPTGAGKTVMLAAIGGQLGGRTLVLQHREELLRQNEATWVAVNKAHRSRTSFVASWQKRWLSLSCEPAIATFAMVPSLSRPATLETMPAFDLVIIDEAHHATAATYRRILDRARELNPGTRILGVTATPSRGDRTRLSKVFTNLADQITLGELIGSGHLVPPRAFVLDVGVNRELGEVRRLRSGEYDLDAAAQLLDVSPVTSAVIEHWRERAGDRRTVVFTGTCAHAEHVTSALVDAGVKAGVITGETPSASRATTLRALESGDIHVLVNVAVATEGWDCPPVSCVVLLRPSSFHSTMVQMIGRGLRTVDPERYPGLDKTDCVVLDFGRSLLTHGGIEQLVDLRPQSDHELAGGEQPTKACPECECNCALRTRECPLCGYQWPRELREVTSLAEFQMVELDLLVQASPFQWWRYNDRCRVATAFETWAVAFELGGAWHAFGGREGETHHLAVGSERVAVGAGDDWMRLHGDPSVAGRRNRWLEMEPTERQLQVIQRFSTCPPISTRYEAACALTLRFNRERIRSLLEDVRRAA